jgi:myo-inositol-1(or 4)-monophosphatase
MAGCFLPVQNEVYTAEKGKGAYLNGMPVHVSKETDLRNILAAYSIDYSDEKGKTKSETEIIARLVNNVRNLRSTNCLLDFCYTAAGKLGASINQTTKVWDIAGPALIIQEAGGKVSDIKGKSLNFDLIEKKYDRNFTIIASNQKLHPELVKLANDGV